MPHPPHIQDLTERVKNLLTKYPHLRDSDRRLTADIWHQQIKEGSVMDFLGAYAGEQLPSEGTITRLRRKLQEDNEDLRGNDWYKRHEQAKDVAVQMVTR